MQKKSILIADSLYGSIQISSFEMRVISTPAFNRLHNIMQNSTVYLTFPSVQTKRFSHSLGVMHLSGQVFYYSLLNACDKVRDEFLDNIYKEINKMIDDTVHKRDLSHYLGDDYVKLIKNYKNFNINEPLFRSSTPSNIKDGQIFAYQIIYQAVRLAALLHDIGHPPFSHAIEYSLTEVWKRIKNNKNKTERENEFCDIMKEHTRLGRKEFHEQVSYFIINRLLDSLIFASIPNNEEEAKEQILNMLSYWTVLKIFNMFSKVDDNTVSKNDDADNCTIFRNIHKIFSNSLDADRLDFVERDLENSGFHVGQNNYDRLFRLMKLMKYQKKFIFCPSIRTLSNIEELFNRRISLYKFIICHHRAVKTDYLLSQLVITLAINYLKEPTKINPNNTQVLSQDISGIWKAIDEVYSNKEYFDALIQWDDSLVFSTFRQRYFSEYKDKKDITSYQLEELLSNKKHYRSMIKRMNNFIEVDNKVIETINIEWKTLKGKFKKLKNKIIDLENHIKYFSKSREKVTGYGFFLRRFMEFLNALTVLNDSSISINFERLVKEAAKKTIKNYKVKDHFVVFKYFKTGLEGTTPYLYQKNEIIKLEDVSTIKEELRLKQLFYPPFFVYIMEEEMNTVHQNNFLLDLGMQIGEGINKIVNKIIKNS